LLDFIGLDTASHIVSGWQDKADQGLIDKKLVEPSPLMQKMIEEGRLGRKSGRGFYDVGSLLTSLEMTGRARARVLADAIALFIVSSTLQSCRIEMSVACSI
jgi:3-hydroxyacyl-CoA dehydrogenase